MGILLWILFGLIAGALAKAIMPGDDPGGFIITTILGIVGAVIGGFIAVQLGFGDITGFDIRSFLIAIAGALLLLFVYRLVRSIVEHNGRCPSQQFGYAHQFAPAHPAYQIRRGFGAKAV